MRDGQPNTDLRPTAAVIGAGVSGLACARALSPHMRVKLFDKSRGVGGRMSTRYAGDYEFDHGAQYFTVRDPDFRDLVNKAHSDGALQRWPCRALYLTDDSVEADRGDVRWVGAPRMNAFPKWLADGLDIETGKRVSSMSHGAGWTLSFEDGDERAGFSAVILAVPAPQALDLLPDNFARIDAIRTAKMDVCFALMIGLDRAQDFDFDTLRAKGLPLDWVAVNSHKPARPDGATTLMIHSEAAWSNVHQDADRDWIAQTLRDTASDLLRTDLSGAPHQALHRWLYSSVAHPAGDSAYLDTDNRIGVCGDWCPGGRVEGAWLSGTKMAQSLLATLPL